MVDDSVSVRIGADAGGVRTGTAEAKSAISSMAASGKADAAALTAEFAKLNAAIAQLAVQSGRTAAATETLQSYANWGAALSVVKFGYEGVTGAIGAMYGGVVAAKDAVLGTQQAAADAAQSWVQYSESLAYSDQSMLHLRTSTQSYFWTITNLRAAYGQLSLGVKEWGREFLGMYGQTVNADRVTLSFAGNLQKLSDGAKDIGFDTATEALTHFTTQLMRVGQTGPEVSRMTEQVAQEIQSSFSRLPNYTAPLNQALVSTVEIFSDSKDKAKEWATNLANGFKDPLTNGKQFLDFLENVDAALYVQLNTARETSDVYRAQAILVDALKQKQSNAWQAGASALGDEAKRAEYYGVFGRAWLAIKEYATGARAAINDQHRDLEESIGVFNRIENSLRNQVASWNEIHNKITEIVSASSSGVETKLASEISTLQQGLRGTGAATDAATMIQGFEKYSSTPYMDRNKDHPELDHAAIGYGTHTLGGKEVSMNTAPITEQQAFEDLKDKIARIQDQLADKIGESWDKISSKAKASMVSMAYNYGIAHRDLLPMISAAKAGDEGGIAAAILARAGDNGGQNRNRREQESANITSAGRLPEAERASATKALNERLDQQQRLNDAKTGGNALDREALNTLEKQLQGDRDEVAAAERKVTAAQDNLRKIHDQESPAFAQAKLALAERQNELDDKMFARDKAKAALDVASAEGDVETYKAKMKLAELTMTRYASAPQSPEYVGAQQQQAGAQKEFDKSNNRDAQADADERYKVSLRELDLEKALIKDKLDLHKMSSAEALAADLAVDDKRVAVEKNYLEMVKNIYGDESAEYEKAQHKMSAVLAQENVRRQHDATQAAKDSQRAWDQASASLSGSMSSSIMGLITHTEKFRDAMRKVATDIVGSFVKMGTDMVASFAMTVAKNIAVQVLGEQTVTAATTAGLTTRMGMEAAAATSGMAIKAGTAIQSIMTSAAEAGAGVTAFLAPLMGPAAIPAGASAEGAVIGMAGALPAFDVGAWSIPHDQLAMVHKNELVMTASQGDAFRNLIASGGAGGSKSTSVSAPVNVSLSALDSRSISRMLNSNGGSLLKAIGRAAQQGAHLGVKGL